MDGWLRSLDNTTAMKITSFRIQTRFCCFCLSLFSFFRFGHRQLDTLRSVITVTESTLIGCEFVVLCPTVCYGVSLILDLSDGVGQPIAGSMGL